MKTLSRICLLVASLAFLALPGRAGAQGYAATPSPDMKGILDALDSMGSKPFETLDPADARKQPTMADAMEKLLKARGQDPAAIKAAMGVVTRDGTYKAAMGDLPARIYRPAADGDTPLPVVLYIHGGGWVVGSIDSDDWSARAIAKKADAMVVSIEYRRAPEYKFPAGYDDAFAAYQWILNDAGALNGDLSRIAVIGEGVGAGMAANVAVMARDRAIEMPIYIGMICPVAGSDMDTPSYVENEFARPLSKARMQWFVKNAFEKPEQMKDKRIDLIHADITGLPQTTIVTAQIDPLRSDGEMLAQAMQKTGGNVTLQNFTGVTHGFFGLDKVVIKAAKAEDLIAGELRKAFEMNPRD
jgi:acetyl esterase/lipase